MMRFTRKESHKAAVFTLTFFSYAFFHANRKAFSNVKTTTGKVWTPSFHNATEPKLKPDYLWNAHDMFDTHSEAEKYQGILDTVFMLAYAVGLFVNGYIGDRVNMRILLTFGMAGTSLMVFIFGYLCEWIAFYNKYFYACIWILNGFLQSTGWPIVVACMGKWFGHGSRGVLLGLWSSCASVGNIIGALLVSSVLSYGYQYAFLITASVLFSGAILVFVGLVPSPKDIGMEEPDSSDGNGRTASDYVDRYSREENGTYSYHHNKAYEHDGIQMDELSSGGKVKENTAKSEQVPSKHNITTSSKDTGKISRPEPLLADDSGTDAHMSPENHCIQDEDIEYDIETTKPQSLSFLKACLLPGVIPYALAYAFLKLVNYSFFFWLPFYLSNAFGWQEDEADRLSTAYDIAGIVGGTLCGLISDCLGKRTVLILPMLLLSIPSLFIYSNSPDNRMINIVIMSVVGFFIGGSANLISAAVSADLGCQKQLEGDDKALATVTGVIDGTGSLGAALGQIAVPYLQTGLGWHSVFYLFMICMFLTAVCLFPLFIKEMCSFRCISVIFERGKMKVQTSREDSDDALQ